MSDNFDKSHKSDKNINQITWDDLIMSKFVFWSIAASLSVDGVLHPLDLVKTRLQNEIRPNARAVIIHPRQLSPYYGNSMIRCIQSVIKEEGFRSLWKGFSVASLSGILSQFSYFASYEFCKSQMKKAHANLFESTSEMRHFVPEKWSECKPIVHLMCGGVAEITSLMSETPLDIVAQRLMVQGPSEYAHHHPYKGATHAFSKIIRNEGIVGLYRGLGASLLTFVPASAISFCTYEHVRSRFHTNRVIEKGSVHSHLIHGMSGATSGFVSAVAIQPLDLARTRLQVQQHQDIKSGKSIEVKYKSTVHTLRTIFAEEGTKALMVGLMPRIFYWVPMSALGFTTYELVKWLSSA